MKALNTKIILTGISLLLLGVFLSACEDQSENIPIAWTSIDDLMTSGWAAYADNDFETAQVYFIEANQRNAFYLPAYNGLGWCAVRLTDFSDAGIQFSFTVTLADSGAQPDLLADAYAGLSLSATIERSVLEISGEGSQEELLGLAQESIDMATEVFNLMGEGYAPTEHDPGFGSETLHLINAQNYFYLQEFESSETELTVVDTGFVNDQLQIYGTDIANEIIELVMVEGEQDTTWYLQPVNLGVHSYTEIVPPGTTYDVSYDVIYDENRIQVIPEAGTQLEEDLQFDVSYVYIDDFAGYLFELIDHINSLIEF
ncbi:hypothetical protein CEE37_07725 [candidate division LCP-89 bacterium B3_LCP]|uniref:Uncharacterized protein n=1 Tax=candidate division LCP-89 bacterium B3_LCP TaxID=2012998 RepID=A0A532V141_UNCL8|nr:MAG: hypothetical protein CEE37_07725 [candidate division LCP-89 bacterium B3_LCP]